MIRQENENKKVYVYSYVTELDTDVAKLKLLKQEFMNKKYSLQDRIIKYFPEEIVRLNNKIRAMEEDTIKLQEEYTKPNADGFSPMKINGNITRINNCLENVAKNIPHERDL